MDMMHEKIRNRHVYIALVASLLLFIQFVSELFLMYALTDAFPEFGTFIYKAKTILVILHFCITFCIIWYAERVGAKQYGKTKV